MTGFASSSGHSGLANTPLARPQYYETIIDRNWGTEFLPEITNSRIDERLFKCGQTVQFMRSGHVAPWRKYELNQHIVPDQIAPDSFCMSICNQGYKAFKFEKQDIREACERWTEFEDSFLMSSYELLAELWRTYVLGAMILEASRFNKGVRAGRYRNINLGDLGAPIIVTPANIITHLTNLKTVLKYAKRWKDGEMFIVIPVGFEAIIAESTFAHQMCCAENSVLIKGMKADSLLGFKVIEQDLLAPVIEPAAPSGIAHYVIAGWSEAFAFAGDIIDAEIRPVEGSFGIQYQMLATWGGRAIYPDGLAVAYWAF
jgi:hypothetical protein